MAEITFDESLRQIRRISRQAEEAQSEARWADAIDAWYTLLAHPCAPHHVDEADLFDEIHRDLRRLERWDDAIAAKREAIARGYRSTPDPEADIAECLVAGGRREQAEALYSELRERDPEDVWLFDSAAHAYESIDPAESSRWALAGIELAFTTGDPEQVVVQLHDRVHRTRAVIGAPADPELDDRVAEFVDAWQPPTTGRHSDGPVEPTPLQPCAYCGFHPDQTLADHDELVRRRRRRMLEIEDPEALERLDRAFGGPEEGRRLPRDPPLAIAWFPADEWPVAVERWPDLLEEMPADHHAYSRAVEARTKRIARGVGASKLHISPLTVAGLGTHSARAGAHASSAHARSAYAAELLRTGAAIRWPPGRNDACWCGSGRKYKQCCGPVPPAANDA